MINIITKSTPSEPASRIGGSVDEHGSSSLSVSKGGPLGTMGYRIQYQRGWGESFREHDDYDENDLSMNLSFKPDPKTKLSMTFGYYGLNADTPGGLTEAQFRADPTQSDGSTNHWKVKRFAFDSRYEQTRSAVSKVTASFFFSNLDRTFFGSNATRINPKGFGGDVFHTLTSQLLGKENELITGLKVAFDRRDTLRFRRITTDPAAKPLTTIGQTMVDDTLIAPYIQDAFTIFDALTITGGLRYETLKIKLKDRHNNKQNEQTFDELIWSIGETEHKGAEARIDLGLGRLIAGDEDRPALQGLGLYGNIAYLDAEIVEFKTFNGNDVPFAPELTWGLGLTYQHPGGFFGSFEGQFIDDQFSDPDNTVAGSADGKKGIIPSRTIWNLNLKYSTPFEFMGAEEAAFFVSVKNITDKNYIETRVSRITPGLPRTVRGGVSFTF